MTLKMMGIRIGSEFSDHPLRIEFDDIGKLMRPFFAYAKCKYQSCTAESGDRRSGYGIHTEFGLAGPLHLNACPRTVTAANDLHNFEGRALVNVNQA